jgi:hypothetical protein
MQIELSDKFRNRFHQKLTFYARCRLSYNKNVVAILCLMGIIVVYYSIGMAQKYIEMAQQ